MKTFILIAAFILASCLHINPDKSSNDLGKCHKECEKVGKRIENFGVDAYGRPFCLCEERKVSLKRMKEDRTK